MSRRGGDIDGDVQLESHEIAFRLLEAESGGARPAAAFGERERNRDHDARGIRARIAIAHLRAGVAEITIDAVVAVAADEIDARQELTTQGILASVEETVTLAQTMEEEINALREWATARARLASAPLAREQGADVRRLEV